MKKEINLIWIPIYEVPVHQRCFTRNLQTSSKNKYIFLDFSLKRQIVYYMNSLRNQLHTSKSFYGHFCTEHINDSNGEENSF